MSTPPPAAEQVVEFLDELRSRGWRIGVEQYVSAQNALVAFYAHGADNNASPVGWIAPIVCGTPDEQESFHAYFDRWWKQRNVSQANADAHAATGVAAAPSLARRWFTPLGPRATLTALCAVTLVAVTVLLIHFGFPTVTDNNSTIVAPPGPVTPPTNSPPPAPTPNSTAPPAPAETPPLIPEWLRTATPAIPFLVFVLWYARRHRGPAALRRLRTRTDLSGLDVRVDAGALFRPEFRQAAQKLRRHRRAPVRELAPQATVDATVRNGGWFTPVYGVRHTVPEYVVLVDDAGSGDQQARFHDEIVRRLVADDVVVEQYHFAGDPRICWRMDEGRVSHQLSDLVARHRDHAVIIFTDGAGLINPLTNLPHAFLDTLLAWQPRAIMTPVVSAQWGYLEATLAAAGFHVCPATAAGVALLADLIQIVAPYEGAEIEQAAHTPSILNERPTRWLDNHEPQAAVASRLCHDLRSALGEAGFVWLAACAVYPALQWDLTVHLGQRLCGPDTFEDTLPAIVRLPWFRYGSMPDWLRLRLVQNLPPECDAQVRDLLRELLLTSLIPAGAGILLRIAKRPSLLARWRLAAVIGTLLRRQPDDSPLKDHVFLSFMEGREPQPLALTVPEALRQVFLTKGHRSLGVRPATVLVVALAVSLFALRPAATSGAALRDFRDANEFYQNQDYRGAAARYEEALAACRGNDQDCRDPAIAPAYFYLANSYDNLYRPAMRGEPENDALLAKAVEGYRKAAELVAQPEIRKLAGQYMVAAYGPDKLNDGPAAESMLMTLIQEDASDVNNYMALAKLYEDAGRYEEAESVLLKARETSPNDASVIMQLAGYYNRQGDFDKTIGALNERSKLEPDNPEGYYQLATYYWDKAYRDFRLDDKQKLAYILSGLAAVDKAIAIKSDYMEAIAYKNLLLRLQATLEKNPKRREELLREADSLRGQAETLRNRQS